LRLSYAFEYAVMEQADKNKNTHFEFPVYDTYQWYLDTGSIKTLNDKYLHGSVPYWNSVVSHPDYDDFWKREAWIRQLHSAPVPNLNVAGFWDQEESVGTVADLRTLCRKRSEPQQLPGRGPLAPWSVAKPEGREHWKLRLWRA